MILDRIVECDETMCRPPQGRVARVAPGNAAKVAAFAASLTHETVSDSKSPAS